MDIVIFIVFGFSMLCMVAWVFLYFVKQAASRRELNSKLTDGTAEQSADEDIDKTEK